METSQKTSLHSFAQTSGIPKSTLHRKAKELGIDTSNGLTEEDRQALLQAIQPKQNTRLLPGSGSTTRLDIPGNLAKAYTPPSVKDLLLKELQQREEVLEAVEVEAELIESDVEIEASELDQLAEVWHQQELRMEQAKARKEEALRRKREMELRKARELGKRQASQSVAS